MTKTEQEEFAGRTIQEQINSVKGGFKSSLEAFNFIVGYLLAAQLLGAMNQEENKKWLDIFKAKLEEVENEKV